MSNADPRLVEALARVHDPELHQDLVSLGMVGQATLADGVARIHVDLTTPACPMKAQIERDVRTAVAAVEGVTSIEVTFGSTVRQPRKEALPGVKHVVAVGSGKGGVGKSTVAANLAVALSEEGASVGILDADIYGPSQAKMFAVEGKRLMADDAKNILPLRNHGVKLISIANLVEDGQALTWRGPILHGTLKQMLEQTVWGDLDYLVVDLPPGTGDVQLSLTQLVDVTGAVLVTTPQEMSLVDVKRAYTMMRKTHVPVLGVVENMSWYALPDGSRDYIFGEGGAAAWAESERLALLGQIPISGRVQRSGDEGTPIVLSDPTSEQATALRSAARTLAGRISIQSLATLPVL